MHPLNADHNNLTLFGETPFESIKHYDEELGEYWLARELMPLLAYKKWQDFNRVINKAITACKRSQGASEAHFTDLRNMVEREQGGGRTKVDYRLTRLACYLIAQNGDSSITEIAMAQTYFATQTRKQELADQHHENQLRLKLRDEMKIHNKALASTAKQVGVVDPVDYGVFTNHGYMGLYGGLKSKDIHAKKKLKKGQEILDHMGSTELAANLFRATQTEEKLRHEKHIIRGK